MPKQFVDPLTPNLTGRRGLRKENVRLTHMIIFSVENPHMFDLGAYYFIEKTLKENYSILKSW